MTYNDESYAGNIINFIPNIENKSYLELGIADNTNFNGILSKHKQSVDVNGRAMFTGTTDEYFRSIDKNTIFDIVYIDANHDYDYVLKDFNNAIEHCKEWLVLHDMIPPNLSDTARTACSDSYRVLYYILKERPDIITYSVKNSIYFGLTFVRMPVNEKLNPDAKYKNTPYDTFIEEIKKYKLYSKEEMYSILNQ